MAFLIVFHHESESGAWLISTYLPSAACAGPRPHSVSAARASAFSTMRLFRSVMARLQRCWIVTLVGVPACALGEPPWGTARRERIVGILEKRFHRTTT